MCYGRDPDLFDTHPLKPTAENWASRSRGKYRDDFSLVMVKHNQAIQVHRLKCPSLRLCDADRHSRLRHNCAYTGDKGGIAVDARGFQQIHYFHPELVNVRIAGCKPHDRLAEA